MRYDFKIGKRGVGLSSPCLIIGEVAQTHDGSLGQAHSFIDAIANAGADAVKFQTHIADSESSQQEPWRIKFSRQDASRFDYWKRIEFNPEQWAGLKQHAEDRNLLFLSSPFSIEAAELLAALDIQAWKVASGEMGSVRLFEAMGNHRKPFLLSSGMSSLSEVDAAVNWIDKRKLPFAVMQCTTEYPCPPERVGLNLITTFKKRYECPVGLSDHSGDIYASLAAVALGANVLEVHVTLSREMFGPDVVASVTTSELRQIVDGTRKIEAMLRHPIDKDAAAGETLQLRKIFCKSIIAIRKLKEGHRLRINDVGERKPGIGIPANRLPEFIGRVLSREVPAGTFLTEDHFKA